MKRIVFIMAAASCMTLTAHPLITVRLNASSRPDDYRKIVEINRKYCGSVDEYWFGRGGAGPRLEILSDHWRTQSLMKAVCENAGIACGFQQGVTLGHGSIYSLAGGGQAKAELHPFTDDAWQIDKDGKRVLMFCPRSAEVLKYEEEHAATLGKILHPVSLWLDDDLRLGFCKPDGCFCTNCLAAFGKKWGQPISREELVKRLKGGAEKDPIRRAWLDFQSESLAIYGAAARRGTNRTNPECLVAYQSVDPMTLETGRDYRPLLNALSDNGKHPTSIRIGSGCYGENLNELTAKMFGVIFEVERLKRSALNLSAISYEQETYRREAIHKTPEAIAVESALAFACGCDAVTEYYWDEKRAEPIWYYEEFARTMSAWRPYFERLAAIARKTSLGGVARFIGSDFDLIAKKTLRSATDANLYSFGVPVTVAASGTRIFYVNHDTMLEWGEGDVDRLLANDAVVIVDAPCAPKFFAKAGAKARAAEKAGKLRVFDFAARAPGRYPTHAERAQLLDAFDSLNGVKLPVRVERSHPLYVYPRVDADGRVVAVTFYNGAAGAMLPTKVRIRRPAGTRATWVSACAKDMNLAVSDGQKGMDGEIVVELPAIPARQIGTVVLTASSTARVVEISKENPRYFETADGKAWIPIGCNICFDRLNASNADVREHFNRWLTKFAANGGNCIRLWAGNRSLEVMPEKPGEFDPEKTKTLKGIIALCEKLGIKVKITLESFRMCKSTEELNKMAERKGVNFGYNAFFNRHLYAPYANSVSEFFKSEKCREAYLGKARYLKNLGFGDSPAVYCWELWNEINATSPMSAYAPWSKWALAELKKMFPKQMTVNNLGSFSDVGAYQPYDELATEADNDFMQVHRYLDAGACLDVCRGPMDIVAASATREALDRRPDRPAIVAEIGAVQANHAGPFPYYQFDKAGTLLHDAIFAAFFAGSAGCGQFWHWDHQYIDGNNLWWQFARFAKAIEGLDPIKEGFRPFYTESRRLRMYGLRGKTIAVVWCRDKASSWDSELVHGNRPETLSLENVPFRNCELDCYLPWEDRRVTVKAPRLPAFKRSIVVRVPANAVEGVVRPH